jgi:hypothetical protein
VGASYNESPRVREQWALGRAVSSPSAEACELHLQRFATLAYEEARMTVRAIAVRSLVTIALIGAPILAMASFAELIAPDAGTLQLAQGGGPGMTGSTGGGNSNAGTAMGEEGGPTGGPDSPDAEVPPRSEAGTKSSRGETEGQGRGSHAGSSGAMRPEPTALP